MSSVDAPPAARERYPAAQLAILVLAIALCRVEVLTSDWGYDAGAWLYISRLMGEGVRPYADVLENKLPPVLWIGRLVLASGAPHLAMFALDVVFTLAAALGLALALESLGARRRTALFFGGLHVLASLPAWEGPHRIEVYSVGCMAVGLALVARSAGPDGRPRLLRAFLAGVALAASASFRQQEALSALVLAAPILLLGPTRLAPIACYAAGGLAVVAALALAAAAGGYLAAMLEVSVLGGLGHAAGLETPGLHLFGKTIHALRGNVERMPVAWLAASAGTIVGAGAVAAAPARDRILAHTALALFAVHVAVTFASGHQWTHYHYPVGWSACLLLGTGWVLWRKRQPAMRAPTGAAPELLLASAVLVSVPFSERVYGGLHRLVASAGESRSDRLELLIRENVPADEGLVMADAYDAIGVLLRLPNPLGSYWGAWAPQCIYEDPARAEEQSDPFFLTGTRWGARLIERVEQERVPWVVRERGKRDRLSLVLDRSYRHAAGNAEFELWRRVR